MTRIYIIFFDPVYPPLYQEIPILQNSTSYLSFVSLGYATEYMKYVGALSSTVTIPRGSPKTSLFVGCVCNPREKRCSGEYHQQGYKYTSYLHRLFPPRFVVYSLVFQTNDAYVICHRVLGSTSHHRRLPVVCPCRVKDLFCLGSMAAAHFSGQSFWGTLAS